MSDTFEITNWTEYFKEFSEANMGRQAKLEILGELGVEPEVRRFPINGIDVELEGDGGPKILLMFGGPNGEFVHLTHTVGKVKRIFAKDDFATPSALDFESADGTKTILTLYENKSAAGH
jgi:hypothetical protein